MHCGPSPVHIIRGTSADLRLAGRRWIRRSGAVAISRLSHVALARHAKPNGPGSERTIYDITGYFADPHVRAAIAALAPELPTDAEAGNLRHLGVKVVP